MTLDTNIIIGYLAGDAEIVKILSQWKEEGRVIFLSAVVEAEILSFAGLTAPEQRRTEEFLESLTFIPFDRIVARRSAEIRRISRIKFPDAAIAATALATYTPLVTRNIRDFQRIPELMTIVI